MFNYRNSIYDTQEALREGKKKREKKKAQHQENHSQTAIFENDLI